MLLKSKTKNNFNYLKITVVSLVLVSAVIFLLPNISFAQIMVPQIGNLGTADIQTVAGTIIQVVLGLLGLIALLIVLYGGFMWMTSGGNEEKVAKAKKILISGVIGLIIILTAYVITSFILETIQKGTGAIGEGGPSDNGFGTGFGSGALGGGVIEYHYPERNAVNIPRNTMIMVTFKVKVATTSVVGESFNPDIPDEGVGYNLCENYTNNNTNGNECGKLSEDIKVFDNGVDINFNSDDNIVAVLTADGKNILLDPIEYLGSADESTYTNVHLTENMLTADGQVLFGGLDNGYMWQFEVSTFLDTTPPTVSFVWPEQDDIVARNAIVQMTFSEPINILSVDGNVIIHGNPPDDNLSGLLEISNQYRTVEFLSDGDCGGYTENSCGEQVFCLPANSLITTTIDSGDTINPLSGISDAADNLLEEDYIWSFNTNNAIDLDPPVITEINPNIGKGNVQPNPNPRISASSTEVISPSSLSTDSFYIYDATLCVDTGIEQGEEEGHKEYILPIDPGNPEDICFPAGGYSVYVSNGSQKCNMKLYSPYIEQNTVYRPRLTSELKDGYGNCFNPALGPPSPGFSGQQ